MTPLTAAFPIPMFFPSPKSGRMGGGGGGVNCPRNMAKAIKKALLVTKESAVTQVCFLMSLFVHRTTMGQKGPCKCLIG